MIIRIIFVLLLVGILSACEDLQKNITLKPNRVDVNDTINKIEYTKDTRTGLCFAIVLNLQALDWGVVSLTNVPCDKIPSSLLE